ncbi:MAG: hypothetical protein V1702_03415, partial [Candidatus Woesearchaeota archaeon]
MSILSFSPAEIPAALSTLGDFIGNNLILCLIIIGSYALFYIYSFLHNTSVDSDVYEIDLLSAGVSSLTTALLLIGLDEGSNSFNFANLGFSEPSTKMAIGLAVYAVFLILFAFTKMLPRFFVVILGNSELDLFINLIAVMIISPEVNITGTLLLL